MSINGIGGGMQQAYPVQQTQKQQVAVAPKIEDEAQSTLLDTEGQKERLEKMKMEAQKHAQEQTKEQMDLSERSSAAMGFGNKIQMELTQSFPPSGSLPMSQLFASGSPSIGASASASLLLMNIQG